MCRNVWCSHVGQPGPLSVHIAQSLMLYFSTQVLCSTFSNRDILVIYLYQKNGSVHMRSAIGVSMRWNPAVNHLQKQSAQDHDCKRNKLKIPNALSLCLPVLPCPFLATSHASVNVHREPSSFRQAKLHQSDDLGWLHHTPGSGPGSVNMPPITGHAIRWSKPLWVHIKPVNMQYTWSKGRYLTITFMCSEKLCQ